MEKNFSHIDNEEDYIKAVAQDCITGMSEEVKETFLKNPNASHYHFGYGLYIRNNYIYPYKLRFPIFMADDLSGSIIERIITLLQNET
jgi:hypothetical protein